MQSLLILLFSIDFNFTFIGEPGRRVWSPQIGTFTKCCLRHDNVCSVSLPLVYNYMTKPRKQNMLVVMPVYRRNMPSI